MKPCGIKKLSVKEKEEDVLKWKKTRENNLPGISEVSGVKPPTGKTIVNIIDMGANTFAYCDDKYVYILSNKTFTKFCNTQFNSKPHIFFTTYSGEEGYLIFSQDTSVFVGSTQTVLNVAYGTHFAYFCNRLFVADGREIKFSKIYDFTDFTFGDNNGGYFKAEAEDGNVLKLAVINEELYIICQYKIIKFSSFDKFINCRVERLTFPNLTMANDTVEVIGENIFFLNGGKLYAIKNGKLEFQSSKLDGTGFKQEGHSTGYKQYYILLIRVFGYNKIFLYDTMTGDSTLFANYGYDTIYNGYFINNSSRVFCKISQSNSSNFLNSEDFGNKKMKLITSIEITISNTVTMKVSGDFGEETFNLTSGINVIKRNYQTKAVTVTFSNYGATFILQKFKIKYREIGE